jgi:RNA polymerase sigma-70 factor (ECF subfamily)
VPDTAEWAVATSGPAVDPADRITLDESVDMAFLVVLDSMTPAERVAFLLHDVFRYSFDEVGRIVGRTPGACRQLASSARRRVRERQPVATPASGRGAVVRRFKEAWEAQDIRALVDLLDPSAVAVADGGGLAAASLHPIEGGEEIARYLIGLSGLLGSFELLERTVNGQPGLVAIYEGATAAVYAFGIVDDRIRNMWVVRNPEKLGSWNRGRSTTN